MAIAYALAGLLCFALFGWELAIGHLVAGILRCVTIIGIPLGLASLNIIPLSLMPLGVRIVPVDEPTPSWQTTRQTPTASPRLPPGEPSSS
jgi:uncharacterized membrane protein YccF (DUF307 family)